MPAVNQQIYADARRAYRAAAMTGLGEAKFAEELGNWTRRVDGEATTEDIFIWAELDRDLPEFKDRREYSAPTFHKISIRATDRGKGMKVPAEAYRKDKWGVYTSLARDMGRSVPIAKIRLMWKMLLAGFGGSMGLAYDGQFFFDTDHKGRDAEGRPIQQSNRSTLPLSGDNFEAIAAQLMGLRLQNGELVGHTFDDLHVTAGPSKRALLKEIFELTRNGDNKHYKAATWDISPYLVGDHADFWFVSVRTDDDCKPLIIKEEFAPEFVEQTAPDTNAMFEFRERRFGINANFGMAFWRWEFTVGSDGTGS
jgi:phage major head subunit gpT-like protein